MEIVFDPATDLGASHCSDGAVSCTRLVAVMLSWMPSLALVVIVLGAFFMCTSTSPLTLGWLFEAVAAPAAPAGAEAPLPIFSLASPYKGIEERHAASEESPWTQSLHIMA
jgi:hypothetical protein